MAQFILQGRLKLLLNSENPVQCKLIGGYRNSSSSSSGVFGFGDFCSIYPVNFNDNNVRRSGFSKKVTIIGSATKGNSPDTVNGGLNGESNNDFDVFDDDDEGDDDLSCFRGLVLDISYRPVNVVCWKRAICLEFMEKADVLEYYDQTVNSPNGSFNIPAVLRVPHLLQVTACIKCNSKKGHKTLEEANMSLVKTPKAPKDYDILAIPLTSAAVRMLRIRKGTPQEWHQYLPKGRN